MESIATDPEDARGVLQTAQVFAALSPCTNDLSPTPPALDYNPQCRTLCASRQSRSRAAVDLKVLRKEIKSISLPQRDRLPGDADLSHLYTRLQQEEDPVKYFMGELQFTLEQEDEHVTHLKRISHGLEDICEDIYVVSNFTQQLQFELGMEVLGGDGDLVPCLDGDMRLFSVGQSSTWLGKYIPHSWSAKVCIQMSFGRIHALVQYSSSNSMLSALHEVGQLARRIEEYALMSSDPFHRVKARAHWKRLEAFAKFMQRVLRILVLMLTEVRKRTPLGDVDCPICMEPIRNSAHRRIGCGHAFHERCHRDYLRNTPSYFRHNQRREKLQQYTSCPTCREPIVRDVVHRPGKGMVNFINVNRVQGERITCIQLREATSRKSRRLLAATAQQQSDVRHAQ